MIKGGHEEIIISYLEIIERCAVEEVNQDRCRVA